TRPAQAPGPSTGVYSKTPCRWQAHSSARAGEVGSAGIRLERTPEDDRASGRRKKNSGMKSNAAHGSETSPSVVVQYETLRGAVLGGVLPPEARHGLMLFLRRGMGGGTRAVALGSAAVLQQGSGFRSVGWTAPDEHGARVHVFPALALN